MIGLCTFRGKVGTRYDASSDCTNFVPIRVDRGSTGLPQLTDLRHCYYFLCGIWLALLVIRLDGCCNNPFRQCDLAVSTAVSMQPQYTLQLYAAW